ncbi:MAG: ABC transporter permease [Lentisphaeria bacterium]|nr:ABC transporter permease [Lentisphaeria bacterium]
MLLYTSSWSLFRREVVRFLRQRSRLIGAFIQPVLFWAVLSSGMKASFKPAGYESVSALDYFMPGFMIMIVLFTAIFSTFSIIEDRKDGFLQGLLVSPAPRLSIVIGKLAAGSFLGVLQALVFFLISLPFTEQSMSFINFVFSIVILLWIGFTLTGLGFLFAWKMESTQGFHSVIMLVMLPMWFFSGAFFPVTGIPTWMQMCMKLNPLTYGMDMIRLTMAKELPKIEQIGTPAIFFAIFTLLIVFFSVKITKRN